MSKIANDCPLYTRDMVAERCLYLNAVMYVNNKDNVQQNLKSKYSKKSFGDWRYLSLKALQLQFTNVILGHLQLLCVVFQIMFFLFYISDTNCNMCSMRSATKFEEDESDSF